MSECLHGPGDACAGGCWVANVLNDWNGRAAQLLDFPYCLTSVFGATIVDGNFGSPSTQQFRIRSSQATTCAGYKYNGIVKAQYLCGCHACAFPVISRP